MLFTNTNIYIYLFCTDLNSYLDIVMTGVDRAGLRQVDEARLVDRSGSGARLSLPTSSPRRNTYLSLTTRDLPKGRFAVALHGKDGSGESSSRNGSVCTSYNVDCWQISVNDGVLAGYSLLIKIHSGLDDYLGLLGNVSLLSLPWVLCLP